jgi:hypothetical protein
MIDYSEAKSHPISGILWMLGYPGYFDIFVIERKSRMKGDFHLWWRLFQIIGMGTLG